MHIAYVTVGNAADVHEWSGLNAAIRSGLIAQGCVVSDVDQLPVSYPLTMRLRKRLSRSVLGTTYALDRSPHAVARWSRAASERIAQLPAVDAVVSTGTLPVADLGGAAPLVLWADATFHSLRTTYPEYASYARASIEEGDRAERAAFDRARLLCFASDWAAADAVANYGVPREKVRVVPFGANTDSPFADEDAAVAAVRQRDWSVTRFVFIGVDWQRKGGDTAVAVVRRLNELGTRCVLTVAGCQPPADITRLPFVESMGFLSKKDPAEAARLREIMVRSHFLLVPTYAECFGLVFAEASAFALPSIARAVGGTPTAVRHGRTGLLLPAAADAGAYCDALQPLMHDHDRYTDMCAAAYRDYSERLNWQVASARFVGELRAITSDRSLPR